MYLKYSDVSKCGVILPILLLLLCSCCSTEKVRVVRYLSYNPKIGDSFSSVACKFGVTEEALNEINPNVNSEKIQPGRYIKVPISEYTYNVLMVDAKPVDSCLNLGREYVCGRPITY